MAPLMPQAIYTHRFTVLFMGAPEETKGFDELANIKAQAAQRWVSAVYADGGFGEWRYAMVQRLDEVREQIIRTASPVATFS
jgi:hypothetical protein